MNDETEIFPDYSQLPAQDFNVADARENVQETFRTQKRMNFQKKKKKKNKFRLAGYLQF